MPEYEARILELSKNYDELFKHTLRLHKIAAEQNELLKETPRMLRVQFMLGMVCGVALSVAFVNIVVLAFKLSGTA